jgi:hypothetical protein
MCLYPRLLRNPKYKVNKKNGGNVPQMQDPRTFYVPVGCGECIECFNKKAREWKVRLSEDIRKHKNGKFITLTFSNDSYSDLYKIAKGEGYNKDNSIATIAVRRFLERYRKEHKKSLRHWLITELGKVNTEHIHLHGIVWSDDMVNVEKHWKYGYVWKGYNKNGRIENYVCERTVNYCMKYFTKRDILHKTWKPIVLSSAGIGGSYEEREDFKRHKYEGNTTKDYYKTREGYKMSMPIYYRNKAYTEDEREKLWIHKLDKNKRYVLGVEIDISENNKEYLEALKYAQQQNADKGYGNGVKDWEVVKYENEMRKLKQEMRLKTTPPAP